MNRVISIPLTYADVDQDWVTNALSDRWPGARAGRVDRGPIFGYKRNKFRISVDYAEGGEGLPTTFIVKGNFPGENDPATGSAWAMANELHSIRDMAPLATGLPGPEWHYIGISEEASAILMEDLAPGGALFFDAFRTLDLAQAMAFIDGFAHMHASTWNSAMFDQGGAMGPDTPAAENRRLINYVYFPTFFSPDNWRAYVELPRGRALPRQYQDLDHAKNAWDRLWALLRQSATVLIHGDEHLGNLYITADGRAGLIDWAGRPEHWPIGIAYFMLCTLDTADRRRWDRTLLSHYLTRLKHHGATGVPAFEEAWHVYRSAAVYPMIAWLNNSAVWQPEAVNTANVVRAATAVLDYDSFGLLGAT